MKKNLRFSTGIVAILLLVFGLTAPSFGQAQQKLAKEPEPSFREDAVSNHRHPEVDTDVFLYINHWRESLPEVGHGGLIERAILTPGDPLHPARKGAVLKYITGYKRASLEPRAQSQPASNAAEQVFFYVTAGAGTVETKAKKAALEDGTAVVVPAGVEFRFTNPGDASLEMIMVTEAVTPGFVANKEISVGSFRNSPPSLGMHWAHIGRGFEYDVPPKFVNPMGFAIVSIDKMDIAQPHVHGPGCEEIWCQLKGRSLLLFGTRLMRQEPGEAFLIPPNNRVPHSSINPTNEPMVWLYMGNRHDKVGQ
jgi:mannose-6-phosphate isomerase-like protein (cupin superfamily)